MILRADPKRARFKDRTNISVAALRGEKMESVDLAELDKPSLIAYMRKDGGANPIAENLVARLLNHSGTVA